MNQETIMAIVLSSSSVFNTATTTTTTTTAITTTITTTTTPTKASTASTTNKNSSNNIQFTWNTHCQHNNNRYINDINNGRLATAVEVAATAPTRKCTPSIINYNLLRRDYEFQCAHLNTSQSMLVQLGLDYFCYTFLLYSALNMLQH